MKQGGGELHISRFLSRYQGMTQLQGTQEFTDGETEAQREGWGYKLEASTKHAHSVIRAGQTAGLSQEPEGWGRGETEHPLLRAGVPDSQSPSHDHPNTSPPPSTRLSCPG